MTVIASVSSAIAAMLRARRRASERRLIGRCGLFDSSYYLINGADVAAASAEPIRHFCDFGWRENRRPNLYFDPAWYRARYGEPDENPLAHYIRCGERQGCRPIPFFDPGWYASTYKRAGPESRQDTRQ